MQHHRWVMEQHLGRPLDTREHVHHIDGNRFNNDLDNLALISARDHSLISKLLICLDRALSQTIVRTLLARFPGLLDD
jgi:hypothetical protein